jgi:hypothetical protein
LSGTERTERGNHCAYALIDARIAELGAARVDGFLRVGVAEPRFNTIKSYVGVGAVARNFMARRWATRSVSRSRTAGSALTIECSSLRSRALRATVKPQSNSRIAWPSASG